MAEKRTFEALRKMILLNLASGQKTVNQIAKETRINWKTVDNHLTYLIGKRLVTEIFSSEYVRIVELSDQGEKHVRRIKPEVKIMKNRKAVLRMV
ncbi:ArsR family transcriptional regulator [Candidatus Woesearchaeota archaeon]|nr:ArsR family transcriptional regulator [Candidatus Woesearchaeota archaeon]